MVGLKFIGKIFKALRSASSPRQIAGGLVLGMLLGLISLKSLFSSENFKYAIAIKSKIHKHINPVIEFKRMAIET